MTFPDRACGVLLHPTALPGPYGIGTLGAQAFSFIRWLKDAGNSYWQICPLTPTGYGDSPYQGFSAFAGNQNLIDLVELTKTGFLEESDLTSLNDLPESYVDFGSLIPGKTEVLHKAWQNYSSDKHPEEFDEKFRKFREDSASWLDDFCLFMVIKTLNNGRPWDEWENPLRFREPEALNKIRVESSDEIAYHSFVQYLFHRQWVRLKKQANLNGISIIGDLPIFVAYDSSDCWANPDLFQLDENLKPTHIAGVPPDYFSATGQLWGNPLYNWDKMEENGFTWWISILKNKLEQYDALRIDHFRGFAAYWSVPYGEQTAVNGKWIPAPGRRLFKRVREVLGELPIIAEDLGVITDDVVELINEFGLPGMKVLQFAFDSSEENDYLPHNYDKNCLVYTGTHDNDTTAGWYSSVDKHDRTYALSYMNLPSDADAKEVTSAMIRTAFAAVSNLAIIPLQDILGLGSEARFNTPGTLGGNWCWRIKENSLTPEKASELRKLSDIYGRRGYSN
ncbi:MAG: 4-alpha-glucanotransferase [Spirochaetes bacterium]|nr:MAG: 4-alpha-glucanotransferase [Spirochaetota bacterium]